MNRIEYIKPFGSLSQRVFLLVIVLAVSSCNPELKKTTAEEFRIEINGQAQGTTWKVVYYDLQDRDFTRQVDSVLRRIDQSISTYLQGSIINKWNNSDTGAMVDDLFIDVLRKSWIVYKETGGAFDPSVKPLVSYWGFGPEKYQHPDQVDSTVVDSLVKLRCFNQLRLKTAGASRNLEWLVRDTAETDSFFLSKPIPGAQLDFNAIGQGWSADQIGEFLKSKGIKIYFIELGGEIVAGFPKPSGEIWRFGIDKPLENTQQRELQAIIQLRNKGLATSGNYRKFYEKDGVKYAHTIDPTTGFPVQHNLLSATVVSDDAGTADAFATAFMVMGRDSAIRFTSEHDFLDNYIYLISSEKDTYNTFTSPELQSLIQETN